MEQVMFGEVSQSRKNNFDIIRLVLAISVLVSHSFPLLTGSNRSEPAVLITHSQLSFGALAVDAFFAISGFLIVQSWLRSKKPGDYFRKRALRIYPGFIVAVLFGVFVIGPLAAANKSDYFHQLHPRSSLLATATLLPPPMPPIFASLPVPEVVNGSLWTIRYEFWCYFMVALLGVFGLLRRPSFVAALFLGALSLHALQELSIPESARVLVKPAIGIFHGREIPYLGNLDYWPRLLTFFLAGSLFFLYRDHIPRSPKIFAGSCLVLLLCLWHGLNAALPIFGVYILFYSAFIPSDAGRWITRHGDFSYGIYLYAFIVQQTLIFEFIDKALKLRTNAEAGD